MTVAIVDYGSGNLRSAQKAFERAAGEIGYKGKIELTNKPEAVLKADRVVLPGVGAFRDCRDGLKDIPGMWEALDEVATVKANPFLGICVGMQLMADTGHELGETPGFGWVSGKVEKISLDDPSLKIPHMGWNTIDTVNQHPVLADIKTGPKGLHAYFVHSYHFHTDNPQTLIATCNYGSTVTAVVGRDNMVGTQFHPEKSQKLGLALIGNFLKWQP